MKVLFTVVKNLRKQNNTPPPKQPAGKLFRFAPSPLERGRKDLPASFLRGVCLFHTLTHDCNLNLVFSKNVITIKKKLTNIIVNKRISKP